MKPRIFIAIQYLEIGGAERSLIGLLEAFDYDKVDVDLFVYEHRGEFMSLIPRQVNLLPEIGAYAAINRPIKRIVRDGHIAIAAARLWAKLQYAAYCKRVHPREGSGIFQYVFSCVTPFLPSLKKYGKYDLAISFLTPHNIVRDKVNARRKMAWIHTDYSTIEVNAKKELPVWGSYDCEAAVSDSVRNAFLQTFPSLVGKVYVVENILSPAFIRAQATQVDVSREMLHAVDEFVFCSVGRYCFPKNFDSVPFICRALINKGIRLKWFIIGYGGDEQLIADNIRRAGMEQVCIMLGKKSNPYPYMAACDVYVQPSRFEGKAVTVREAQILGKPVVVTNFPTAASQLDDGIDGVIVPLDIDGCAQGIADFLANPALRQMIVENLRTRDYSNMAEARKIENIATA